MKKLAYLFVFALICYSCSKEKDPVTTYQIINNVTLSTTTVPYLDGSAYEVMVFHYKGTDIMQQDNYDKISAGGGKTEVINVPAGSEKIKVSFKFLPPQSAYYSDASNVRKYVVAYTIIEKGKNNVVTLTDNTAISSSAKSTDSSGLLNLFTGLKKGRVTN